MNPFNIKGSTVDSMVGHTPVGDFFTLTDLNCITREGLFKWAYADPFTIIPQKDEEFTLDDLPPLAQTLLLTEIMEGLGELEYFIPVRKYGRIVVAFVLNKQDIVNTEVKVEIPQITIETPRIEKFIPKLLPKFDPPVAIPGFGVLSTNLIDAQNRGVRLYLERGAPVNDAGLAESFMGVMTSIAKAEVLSKGEVFYWALFNKAVVSKSWQHISSFLPALQLEELVREASSIGRIKPGQIQSAAKKLFTGAYETERNRLVAK